MNTIRTFHGKKRSEHYVNNKEFLAAIVEYKEKVALAAEKGETKPVIPRYIGECFLKYCNSFIL